MIEPYTGREMGCYLCKHFHRKTRMTCAAFPEGIPFPIASGAIAHVTPIKNDNGIMFEVDLSRYLDQSANEKSGMASLSKAWVEEDHPRHPAGTPVDPESGAGGGRFAPRETSGEVSPQSGRRLGVFDERPSDPYMKALDEYAHWFASLRNEELSVFDDQGELIFSVIGQKASVELTDTAIKMARGQFQVHNHPSASAFSDEDYASAVTTRASGIAVAAGDYIYRLDLPPEFYEQVAAALDPGADWRTSKMLDDWHTVRAWFKDQWAETEMSLRSVMLPLIDAGKISREEASLAHMEAAFSRQIEWFASQGAKLSRIERVPGFFTEAGPDDLAALEAARVRVLRDERLSYDKYLQEVKRRSERFVLVTGEGKQISYAQEFPVTEELREQKIDPAGAAVVMNGVRPARSPGSRPSMGAPDTETLMGAVDAGIRTFYFGGITQAYRLRVRDAAGMDSAAFLRARSEIVSRLVAGQHENERYATDAFGYRDDLLNLRGTDLEASDALVNHLALIELSARFPSVIEYRGLYYPGKNPRTVDPGDRAAVRRLVE